MDLSLERLEDGEVGRWRGWKMERLEDGEVDARYESRAKERCLFMVAVSRASSSATSDLSPGYGPGEGFGPWHQGSHGAGRSAATVEAGDFKTFSRSRRLNCLCR